MSKNTRIPIKTVFTYRQIPEALSQIKTKAILRILRDALKRQKDVVV